ncbi:WD40 repeat domain-containing protein [Streptomyces sp. YIM S03343]
MRRMVRFGSSREIARFSSGFNHVVRCVVAEGLDGGPLLFSSTADGENVTRWDIRAGAPVWCDTEGMPGINGQALVRLPDGGLCMAIPTEDGIEWWDAMTGCRRPEMTWEDWTIWDVAAGLLPDGRPVLLGAGHEGRVYRWDAADGELLGMSPMTREGGNIILAVGFVPSPGGSGLVVSGDEIGRIWRWDITDGSQAGDPILGHDSQIRSLRALPHAEKTPFVSCDADGVLKVWDAATGDQAGPSIEAHTDLYDLEVADMGDTTVLFAAGADDVVRAWDPETCEPIELSLRGTTMSVLSRPDGTALVVTCTAQGDFIVRLYSLRAGHD